MGKIIPFPLLRLLRLMDDEPEAVAELVDWTIALIQEESDGEPEYCDEIATRQRPTALHCIGTDPSHA